MGEYKNPVTKATLTPTTKQMADILVRHGWSKVKPRGGKGVKDSLSRVD